MTVIPEKSLLTGTCDDASDTLNIRRHRILDQLSKKKTGGIVNYCLACLFLFFLDNSTSAH